jgi:hypothetical protein
MTGLAASWQSAKVVRTREKVSFFFGVMNLVISALMFGMAPQYVMFSFHTWIVNLRDIDGCISGIRSRDAIFSLYAFTNTRNVHGTISSSTCAITSRSSISYSFGFFRRIRPFSLLAIVYLTDPLRVRSLPGEIVWFFTTRTRLHRYMCISTRRYRSRLSGTRLWFMHLGQPSLPHSHRHFYPNAAERFPALNALPHLEPLRALLLSGGICQCCLVVSVLLADFSLDLIWQSLYWKVS